MPIAATTVALGGAIAAALAWIVTRDDDDDELDDDAFYDETDDPRGPSIAAVDLTYLDEGEGDPVIDVEPYVPVVPKVATFTPSQSGYPWESSPPPGSGYDESLFPDFYRIRTALRFLNYDVPSEVLGVKLQTAPPLARVKEFQRNYNQASERGYRQAKGYLEEDGIPGARTLRALERAAFGTDKGTPDDIVRGAMWATEFDLW